MFLICFPLITVFTRRKIYIKTSTMAAVMAVGIITQGVFTNYFSFVDTNIFGKLLSAFTISLWASFLFSLVLAFRDRQFINIHYDNPINRFGIGTWVASTSVCSILISNNFPERLQLVKYVTILNVILWMTYIIISIIALRDIHRLELTNKVHGILLLTTVSTQSIVLLLNTVFKEKVAFYINISLLLVGTLFYIICAILILNRYLKSYKSLNIEDEWQNTNCILHGAVSITGLACILSNAFDDLMITLLWVIAASVFLVVELVEIYRLFKRIKRFGIWDGLIYL